MQYFEENDTRFYSNQLLLSSNAESSELRERTEMVSLFDLAERKRFSILFSALRFGIKART